MTADYVIRMYFEALKPTPEEARAMSEAWLVLAETGKTAQRLEQSERNDDV